MNKFRHKSPVRTFISKYNDYRRYKEPLSKDFSSRCGYTDTHHQWFGGIAHFQIDHFKAKSLPQYAHLENEYSNLVYTCPLVNRAKWNKDSDLFLDPCDNDLNEHLYRDENGNICYKEDSIYGKFMYDELKLYLRCYGTIWTLEQIEDRLEQADRVRDLLPKSEQSEINELIAELNKEFISHRNLLRKYYDGEK